MMLQLGMPFWLIFEKKECKMVGRLRRYLVETMKGKYGQENAFLLLQNFPSFPCSPNAVAGRRLSKSPTGFMAFITSFLPRLIKV
jgi:hypothetical protein